MEYLNGREWNSRKVTVDEGKRHQDTLCRKKCPMAKVKQNRSKELWNSNGKTMPTQNPPTR